MRGYNCENAGGKVEALDVENQVGDLVQAFELPPDWKREIKKELDKRNEIPRILDQRRKLEEKKKRVVETYWDGSITKDKYDQVRNEICAKLNSLIVPNSEEALAAGRQVESFKQVWSLAKEEDKREMVKWIFEWVEVDVVHSRVTRVNPRKAFAFFFDQHPMLVKDAAHGGYRVQRA